MKELRITKARMVELIKQYRGKYNGIAIELSNGGINPELPYTQRREAETGDYIFMQEKPKKPEKKPEKKSELPKVNIEAPEKKEKKKVSSLFMKKKAKG